MFDLLPIFFSSFQYCFCANILFVSTFSSPSHHIWNKAISLELLNGKHNVTTIGPDTTTSKIQNYTHIIMEGVYEKLDGSVNINDFASYGPISMTQQFHDWYEWNCKTGLQTDGLQALLNYPKDFKFDLIIFDVTGGPCYYPLLHAFNYPPALGVTAFLLPTYISHRFGNHLYPSYIPWHNLPYHSDMTFLQRVMNFLFTFIELAVWEIQDHNQHVLAQQVFGKDIPSVELLQRHIPLVLANTDPILNQPQPLPPNIIPVGGLHARKSKRLPQDLQEVMDANKNGVIIFSLGTNVRSDKLPSKSVAAILEAFSHLAETVIWKFEGDMIKNLSKNVIVRKWLPQNDLLGHPKVRLFIGHGGALSTQESMFHGVLMIGIPFFVDQHITTKNLIRKKVGVRIDVQKITSEYFLKQIRDVLDNPIYRENMGKLSRLFRDRSETPLERAIFWIEYVLRNKGADFLQTQAQRMSFVKSYGIDVFGFLVALLLIFIIIVWISIKIIVHKLVINKKPKLKVQ